MGLEKQAEFTRDDLKQHKAFQVLVNNAKFELKGDATLQVALLMQWFKGLEVKIENHLDNKGKVEIKPIES